MPTTITISNLVHISSWLCIDNVFSPDDSTEIVYEQSCRQLIQNVLQGYNATIFLYGQTTSGKTYTMLGNESSPGIIPFTLLDLFREAE